MRQADTTLGRDAVGASVHPVNTDGIESSLSHARPTG